MTALVRAELPQEEVALEVPIAGLYVADILVPRANLIIEANGMQHYVNMDRLSGKSMLKTRLCERLGYAVENVFI